MEILRISTKDTLPIRNEVLRNGLPVSSCYFEGDNEDQTFHLGARVDAQLVCIASFYFVRHENFPNENQFQLRGMATLENYRGRGLAQALLKMAFPIIEQNFCDLLWCNARVEAMSFYENLGFEKTGEIFDVKGVGPHRLMFKHIE